MAREGEPPRVAIVTDAIQGVDGVTRTIEELRGRGVPVIRGRGGGNRPGRRPPAGGGGRARGPLLPRAPDRGSDTARPGRGPRGGPLRRGPPDLSRPRRGRRRTRRPHPEASSPREPPYGARGPRAPALRRLDPRGRSRSRAGRLLRCLRHGPLAQRGGRRVPEDPGRRRRQGGSLGAGGRAGAVRTAPSRRGAPARRAERPLRRAADPGEGGRAARRVVPRRSCPGRAHAPRARRRRPRRGAPA